jgi:hypothetical protein
MYANYIRLTSNIETLINELSTKIKKINEHFALSAKNAEKK